MTQATLVNTAVCGECEAKIEHSVCFNKAGYYIGTFCDCGPYSQYSGYYKDYDSALFALVTKNYKA
jgi:hypothetical protein